MSEEIKFNYQAISNNLLKKLPSRSQNILGKRFGLNLEACGEEKMTLEAIGKEYNLSRERVRQIEEGGLNKVKEIFKADCREVFQYFENQIRTAGSLRKEDCLVSELGLPKHKNQILFLLTLNPQLQRFKETEDLYQTKINKIFIIVIIFLFGSLKGNHWLTKSFGSIGPSFSLKNLGG